MDSQVPNFNYLGYLLSVPNQVRLPPVQCTQCTVPRLPPVRLYLGYLLYLGPVWKNLKRCPQYGPSRPPKLLKPSSKLLGRPPKLMERQELPNQEFCPSISNNSKITPNSTRGISTFISKFPDKSQLLIICYLSLRLPRQRTKYLIRLAQYNNIDTQGSRQVFQSSQQVPTTYLARPLLSNLHQN